MRSKGIHPVHERWWAGPELPLASWPAQMPARAASTVAEILRWMIDGTRPADIPEDVEAYQGDILTFLTGKRPIEDAIKATWKLIEADPVLDAASKAIELLPLYGELPAVQRRRALDPASRRKNTKYRVIFSTNLAETSLTIEGIRHVIDSGLINRKRWDSATATESMEQVPHSQHGLRQRRGRAGRTQPGIWHCLYTEAQLASLDSETPPEITRAPLPAVVLAASVAGVSDPNSLTWLAPGPPAGEVTRTIAALRAIGAIDEHGDPTPVGRELASTRASFDDAAILITADQAGCAVEAATVLAAKSTDIRTKMLSWSRKWPATAKLHVNDVHEALLAGATDDVDVACRIWSGWEAQPDRDRQLAWARRHYVDPDVMDTLARERMQLLEPLMAKTRSSKIRPLDPRLLPRLRAAIAWASPNSIYSARSATPADERSSLIASLSPAVGPRSDQDVVAAMHSAAPPAIDDDSWVSRHLPGESVYLVLLDRQVRSRFSTPLAPPERVLLATFCVAVPQELIFDGDDWLAAVARIPRGPRTQLTTVIPGDRFLADLMPSGDGATTPLRLLAALAPTPDPTIESEDEDDSELEADDGQDDAEEVVTDAGGRSDAASEQAAELETVPIDDPEPDDAPPEDTGAPATLDPVLELPARLDPTHRDQAPAGAFEVVVSHIDETGMITCRPDTRSQAFAAFVESNLHSTVTFQFDCVRVFPRDREPVLIARHDQSTLTTAIDPFHIGTGLRYPQMRAFGPGDSWDFELLAADQERFVLELSQTDATLRALSRLSAGHESFRTTATIVDVFRDSIHIQIRPDGILLKPGDPPLVSRIYASDLPLAPERIKLGADVPVVLTWNTRRRETVSAEGIDIGNVPTGPWELRANEIAATDVITVADWRRLIGTSSTLEDPVQAARFRNRVSRLAVRVLTPRVRVIDTELFTATVAQGRVDAQITSVLPDGALKVQTPVGEQVIRSREANLFRSLGNSATPGSSVPVFVDEADAELEAFAVRLFDPAARSTLSVGDIVEVRVGAPTTSGKEAHIHTLTGVEGLARNGSLPAGASEGVTIPLRIAELPETGMLRFSGRLTGRFVAMSPQLAAAIQPDSRGRGKDLRPFTGQDASIDVSIPDSAPSELQIWSDGSAPSHDASQRLVASLTGTLWQASVPHHQPLRAGNRETLRTISASTGCTLIDGQRKNDRGYPENVVWIAAPDDAAASAAAELIRAAFPDVFVTEWFKRTGAEWSAATNAVKAQSGRMRSVKAFDVRGKAIFRAVLECQPGEQDRLLLAARAACPSIPSGSFQADPSITVERVNQTNPSTESRQSRILSSAWVAPAAAPSTETPPARHRSPTADWAARPLPGSRLTPAPATRPSPAPPTSSWQPTPSSGPPPPRRPQPTARTITRTGPTVDKAVAAACAELGVRTSQVTVEVLDDGKRGLIGRRPAEVRVTLR
jgi:hypothetical protein